MPDTQKTQGQRCLKTKPNTANLGKKISIKHVGFIKGNTFRVDFFPCHKENLSRWMKYEQRKEHFLCIDDSEKLGAEVQP